MIKTLLLIFSPARAWDSVVEDKRGILFILFLFLVPLLALTVFGECYGLYELGKSRGAYLPARQYDLEELKVYGALQFSLSLVIVFVGAWFIRYLSETFRGESDFTHAFRVVAYALGPLFLCRLLDGVPMVQWWLAWAIGIVLTVSTMYHGVPRVMDPDPPQAFGLYVTSAFLLTIVSGLARYLSNWWLEGKFARAQEAASKVTALLGG
jgi:hypothetical protein